MGALLASETEMKQFNAIILFADLVSSSRMSDVLNPKEYLGVLKAFQSTGHEIVTQLSHKLQRLKGIVQFCEGEIRGEEIQIIIGFDEFDRLPKNSVNEIRLIILSMIEAALELSVNWFLSPTINRPKHTELAAPSRIGIGLHFGKVYPFRVKQAKWKQVEWRISGKLKSLHLGSSINFGKRVETASRLSKGIGIAISQSFYTLCVEYGVPVVCGERLESAPKGFEYPQPVFDLKQQYAMLSSPSLSGGVEKIGLLHEALYHDPNRIQAYYSLAIESLIDVASFSKNREWFDQAVKYSQYPLGVLDNPEYFHWLMAIALYRRASTQSAEAKKQDIETSILHYERASQKIAWAYLDLAAAYWTRSGMEIIIEKKIEDLQHARDLLSGLIQKDPLLFHAYNVRALVSAELTKQLQGEGSSERENLLENALADLSIARALNRQPEYMYLGTEATIEKARGKLKGVGAPQTRERVVNLTNSAEVELKKAIGENQRLRGIAEEKIPDYHFWRPGFTDPPYHPPRPISLTNAWARLREEN
jgi:class 3 adenylate cyclase